MPPAFDFCALLGDFFAPIVLDEFERMLVGTVVAVIALFFEVGGVSFSSGYAPDFSDDGSFHWPDSLLLIFPLGVRATCSFTSAEMFLSSGVGEEENLAAV